MNFKENLNEIKKKIGKGDEETTSESESRWKNLFNKPIYFLQCGYVGEKSSKDESYIM